MPLVIKAGSYERKPEKNVYVRTGPPPPLLSRRSADPPADANDRGPRTPL
jgi:hypothetical protein